MEVETVLSERYSVPVLLFLYYRDEKTKFQDLRQVVSNYPTLEKLMVLLEQAGLIELSKVNRPYKTNFAELTDLGYRVAKKLAAANDIALGKTPEPETNCSDAPQEGRSVN